MSEGSVYQTVLPYPRLIVATGLALLVIAAFWPLRTADFVHLDDPLYITNNPRVFVGLTPEGLWWAWTEFHAGFWAPVLWISFMIDIALFGPNPGAFHVVNMLWHAGNTVLLFIVLNRLTGALWRSAAVAALFAVHPLRVESVAWIVERKDVLSLFFGLLAIRAYTGYVENGRLVQYVLVALFLALGLMAKSMIVTLPCLLLLLDYWPLRRWGKDRGLRLFLEKLPLFALSAVSAALTFLAHRSFGGVQDTMLLPLLARVWNAVVAYAWYLVKLIWPVNLTFFYPYPEQAHRPLLVAGAGLLLAGITALILRHARQRPYLVTGWCWYLGALAPVIGLVQAGMQAWADRFTYLPMIGVTVMLVWLAADLSDRWGVGTAIRAVAAGAALAALLPLTRLQAATWQNTETLAHHALRIDPGNFLAETILGNDLEHKGKDQEAIEQYRRAVRANPEYFVPYSRLGVLMEKNGRLDEAIQYYARALRLNPNLPGIQLLLGRALQTQGRVDEALILYLDVLRRDPRDPHAHYITGTAYEAQGDTARALAHYDRAAAIDPAYAAARDRLRRQQTHDAALREDGKLQQ